MAMPVLATKLFIPVLRPRAVPRPRLVERLREGLHSGRKLTLISAPAGFGKTTLLSEWIADARRRDPQVRVGWLSLDEGDNDPSRFLTYLVSALQRADPALGLEALALPGTSFDPALTTLINDVAQSSSAIILVLDDFQLIEDESIRDAVVFLLDHLPSNLHLAIASRSDPLLPVARLRAGGELTELRAADLRFTPDEAAVFLGKMVDLDLSAADVAALDARTEGWIAGLQLAALSMRDRSDVSGFIEGFTGSNRFVLDYLAEEVLQRQPDEVREFLLHTSVLNRLSGPLCDAVTGQAGSSEMLESLERDNLFVVPLDDRRRWYRYHHLFADVLRARLLRDRPDRVSELHVLASEWYERNDLPEDAVTHALAAADFGRAARVIEAAIPVVRKSRQDATLLRWLTLLPDEVIDRRPVLGVYCAWSSLVAGDVEAVEPRLRVAERALATTADDGTPTHDSAAGEELRMLPVMIAVYRAAVAQARGNVAEIRVHAERALELVEPADHLGRGAAAGFLGLAAWATGDLEGGVRAFREVRTSLLLAGNVADALGTTIVLADMLIPLGRLREAQRSYEQALLQAAEQGEPPPQSTADLHVGLSELLRERGELAAAAEHLATSEALGEHASLHENRHRWFVAMASLREAEGQLDAALELLTTAVGLHRRGFFPEVRPISAMKARIWIAHGRLADAEAWVSGRGLSAADDLSYLREFEHITLARLLIAQHRADPRDRAIEAAAGLLDRLLAAAEAGGRTGSAIEILVLRALALGAQGRTALALQPLQRALALAEPEGYLRIFADEGEPLTALLGATADAGILPDYVRRLRQAMRQTTGDGVSLGGIPDPLSERELHVLRLLATELSGPQIARELYVSLNTLRTHTRHIFGKLDVNSRPAAVGRATELGLI
ncbi:LuxR C-terminal-related transcriptional regulator [Cryobacterium tagatosivorans]|uniref:Helix-turn-helix transcriptional regulator n=1 Tax=Cryobacterium tagatosivorans TaxID=1259199 RepID=A0A4R8UBJ0_9MICO|nr:LuxR C-terminal-related transcriptional regulator [Cryobacterium tagatosivorans]TFB48154.1 helix-turn-helix transcriptional regulator [Cryobacterium tagatosivorans]